MKRSNHTEVPNEFFDEWMPKLKGSEIQVFMIICRQTRGWHKETDRISISQLQKKTGLSNRAVIDASKSLEDKGLIYTEMNNGIKCYEIAYEKSSQSEKEGVKKVHRGSEKSSQVAYEESSHTKETITKETIQNILVQGVAFDEKELITDILEKVDLAKEPESKEEKYSLLAIHIWNDVNQLQPNNQTTLKAKIGSWYHPIRLMVEQDKRDVHGIWKIWKRAHRDDFWKKNVLSTKKLREQFDQLAIKFNLNDNKTYEIIDALYG